MPDVDGFIIISADGESISGIYDDNLAPLLRAGQTTVKRASHVEPDENGYWRADMSPMGGPVLQPRVLRATALADERKWLYEHMTA